MKFKSKVIEVEAEIWTGKNERTMFDFLTDTVDQRITLEEDSFRIDLVNGGCQVGNLVIKTREGEMKADIGDYVVKEPLQTTDRKFYPVKPEIFKYRYEKVAEECYRPDGGSFGLCKGDPEIEDCKHCILKADMRR